MNIIQTNIDKLVEGQSEFIPGSYEQFIVFGGPCVYFHSECLVEGNRNFLSKRHTEVKGDVGSKTTSLQFLSMDYRN